MGIGLMPAPTPGGGRGPLLPRDFFARPATEVAPGLLGCVLSRQTPGGLVTVVLTEVEAYAGSADEASHAYRGRTARNAVMFGPPGHAYVYFTYGMYFCMNLVCQPEGEASAVLLRAGRVIAGAALAAARRYGGAEGASAALRELNLARGPARLCQALGIDRSLDGTDVCDPASPLQLRAATSGPGWPGGLDPGHLSRGPRVGVATAADIAWRFWITGEPAVSPYRAHTPRRARVKPVSAGDPADGTMQR